MKIKILPTKDKFFTLFNRQVDILLRGAETLKEISENLGKADLTEKVQEINNLEHLGDDLIDEMAYILNKTFVTPIDREDIHELAMFLDDIIDYIQGAVTRIDLYKIQNTTTELKELSDIILRSCFMVKKGFDILPKFSLEITDLRKGIKILEREADAVYRNAQAHLFEGGLKPIDVIKWKDIYTGLETAVNKCEKVFNVLEAVVLKHA